MSVETMPEEPVPQDQADDLISQLEALLAGGGGEVSRLVDAVDAQSASLEREVNALLETASPLQPLDPIVEPQVTRPPAVDQAAVPADEPLQALPAEEPATAEVERPADAPEPDQEPAPAPPSIGQLDVLLAEGAEAAVEKPEEESQTQEADEPDEAPDPPPGEPPPATPADAPEAAGDAVPAPVAVDRVADEMAMWDTVPSTQGESPDPSGAEPSTPVPGGAPPADEPAEDSFAGAYLTPEQILNGLTPQPPAAVPDTSASQAQVRPPVSTGSLLTRVKRGGRRAMAMLRLALERLLVICELANRPLQGVSANTRSIVGYIGLLTLFNGAVLMVGKAISVYFAN